MAATTTASVKVTTLTAVCVVRDGTRKGLKITDVVIYIPGTKLVVAKAAGLVGRYSPEQAMKEFGKNPGRFVKGDAYPTAQAMKLVA